MPIPTEPIGSIPRPLWLLEAIGRLRPEHPDLDPLYERAIKGTIALFEATGSPVISDGEQRKFHNFWTYRGSAGIRGECSHLAPKAMF